MNKELKKSLTEYLKQTDIEGLNELHELIQKESELLAKNPVGCVKWVPIEEVEANDYNPNAVAKNELRLLYVSIDHDGYTQPVVTIFDEDQKKYIIVDGFHRYFVMRTNPELRERNGGRLPVVVLDKSINDRMASTVRHNRARGKHSVSGMGNIVMEMVANGWSDVQICDELGLEADELMRLKHTTGVAKLFADREFSPASMDVYQLRAMKEAEDERMDKSDKTS